jgi:hypothetical protein
MDVVSRRLELLKLEGLGLSQAEIVKELCKNSGCAERTIYHDFETRATWQPILLSVMKPEDIALKILNRYEQAYRQASKRLVTCPNPFVQIYALNTMIKVNSLMFEALVLPEVMCRLKALEQKAAMGVFVP